MKHENLSILLVDDDEVDRLTVKRALQKSELQVNLTEVVKGEEALAILKQKQFQIILLDYRLPDADGLSLIHEIRELEIDTPSIVLTGQGDELIAVEIMKAGAADYLSKNIISSELLTKSINNAIRVYRAELAAKLANRKLKQTNELLILKNQELERQKHQIKLQNIQLQQSYRLKSEFLATMSHELRTPMNAIMGFSQLLLRQYPAPLSSQQTEIVQRIFNNSQNLLNMIEEILDFSKIESGKFELSCEELDLENLVNLTVEELRSLVLTKQLNLTTDCQITNSLIISDRNCLKRILINLLGNAIKFTQEGAISVKISEINPDTIAIAISDTGIGIAPEHLQTIFQAFRQIDQSLTRKYAGTGLGLAITDSLVKMLDGNITVTSELGKGSTFQVQIPRKIASS
jgi:signal transduction histidine kinase